jgi:hypothetical protein
VESIKSTIKGINTHELFFTKQTPPRRKERAITSTETAHHQGRVYAQEAACQSLDGTSTLFGAFTLEQSELSLR